MESVVVETVVESFAALYFTAFFLGAVHALEVDHMIAVSVFTGFKPDLNAAAGYGARWGLGHAAVVVLVGTLITLLGWQIPSHLATVFELGVGVSLIALGWWAWRKGRRFHVHTPHEHDTHQESLHGHLHSHNSLGQHHHEHGVAAAHQHAAVHTLDPKRHHQHLPTFIGALHGLAGSAPLLALIPITLLPTLSQAFVYLVLFSLGTTLAMMAYATLAAAAMQGIGNTQRRIRLISQVLALITIAIGIWWLLRGFVF